MSSLLLRSLLFPITIEFLEEEEEEEEEEDEEEEDEEEEVRGMESSCN
jgi:hypothetical protein